MIHHIREMRATIAPTRKTRKTIIRRKNIATPTRLRQTWRWKIKRRGVRNK